MAKFIILSCIVLFAIQEKKTLEYENDEFIIRYLVLPSDSTTTIKGTINHKKDGEPANGTNIWTECLNKDGSQNGTIPKHNVGEFELELPPLCNKISFQKIPHKRIDLTIKLNN